jgi:rhamnulokinase
VVSKQVIAIDLGAESGRVMRVDFDGERLQLHEMHRFLNTPVQASSTLYWDVLRQWHEIQQGIRLCGKDAASLGVDTWGVDFALFDRDGQLLANPMHYRDSTINAAMMDEAFERVPRRDLFERTGIQFMPLNGLYRLARMARNNSPVLNAASLFLTIADVFNTWLSGSRTCEFTHVTTQQMFNPRLNDWDRESLSALGIPTHILPEIVQPGTRIGEYEGIPVIVPACHDTGSAVVAVPTTHRNYAYLSSGTWSLLGLEVDQPIINDAAYEANLTNEGGVYGKYRLLKNIAGMWLIQQCRSTWKAQGRELEYAQLAALSHDAAPFQSLIDPDDPSFIAPGDMPSRIREYCQRTGQPVPQSEGEITRCIYESLALKYRQVLELLTNVSGQQVEVLHIIGGGSKNALLNQMTADATGCTVIAGPTEATAIGNALVQLISLGELSNIDEARTLLSHSADTQEYQPQNQSAWDEPFEKFKRLLNAQVLEQ